MARPFYGNPYMNEDPLTRAIDNQTFPWYAALCLIVTNLPGLLGTVYLCYVGNTIFGVSIGVAFFYSLLYHACQTLAICIGMNLVRYTIMDHITAPSMLAMFFVFTVAVRYIESTRKKQQQQQPQTVQLEHVYFLGDSHIDSSKSSTAAADHPSETTVSIFKTIDREKSYYATSVSREEYTVHDTWSATVVYCYIFVAVNATLAHPFSMQSFLIVVAFGIGVLFFKVIVIDDGHIAHNTETVSLPDVIVGIALIVVSLVCFFLDAWVYWVFHSIWHALSFTGVFFYGMGLCKGLPNYFSPYEWVRARIFHCHGQAKVDAS